MNEIRQNAEILLASWLKLYSTVWNERIVTGMTFNEAYICNLLLHRSKHREYPELTATDLCNLTGLLKSQMNKTLGEMDQKGYIIRTRSTEDRRVVYIKLSDTGAKAYNESHEKTMKIIDTLAVSLGNDGSLQTAEVLNHVADEMKSILREGTK